MPLTEHAYKDATLDEGKLRDWWTATPEANVGVATGASGLVVIDVDPRNGGRRTFIEVEASLPADTWDTVRANTGGGGMHFVYAALPGIEVKTAAQALGPGMDVKASTGYILVEPSIHPSGRQYAWVRGHAPWERAPKPLPKELLALIRKGPTTSASTDGAAPPVPSRIPKGMRDSTLLSMAGTMRARGFSQESIDAALIEVNRTMCDPPQDQNKVLTISRRYAGQPAPAPIVGVIQMVPGGAENGNGAEPGANGHKPTPHDTLPDGLLPNDLGNAARLVRDHGADIRYVHDMERWILRTDGYWPFDETERVVEYAKSIVFPMVQLAVAERQRATEFKRAGDEEHAKNSLERARSIRKFAVGSGDGPRIANTLRYARPLVPILARDLDRDDWVLDAPNCTIDLRTGQALPHDADRFITKRARVPYEPGRAAPKWEAFVDLVTSNDKDKRRFLQQACGYALTGSIGEQCVFFLYGEGGNGKSVYMETVRRLLGTYGRHADAASFEPHSADKVRSDIARLQGHRLVTTSEGDPADDRHGIGYLSESVIKKLTGGEPVVASFKFKDEFEYTPKFKLFWYTNHKPKIRGGDHGIWRRIRVIPFTAKIPESGRRSVEEVAESFIADEGPGILNWLVQGCLDWQRENVIARPPRAILEAVGEYREEMNPLADFMEARAYLDAEAKCAVADLYRAYLEWCSLNGDEPAPKHWLAARLREQGVTTRRGSHGVRLWAGIGLLDDAQRQVREFELTGGPPAPAASSRPAVAQEAPDATLQPAGEAAVPKLLGTLEQLPSEIMAPTERRMRIVDVLVDLQRAQPNGVAVDDVWTAAAGKFDGINRLGRDIFDKDIAVLIGWHSVTRGADDKLSKAYR